MKYKYIFLDLDGTVTESRQKIKQDMRDALALLPHTIIISGAARTQMEFQLDGIGISYLMAQSGNDVPGFWFDKLTPEQEDEIFQHISQVTIIKDDMIENRGAQITLSFTGHHAPIEIKKNWDTHQSKRKAILRQSPFVSQTLTCRIAGTTCFDYTRKAGTKGKNIQRFIELVGWAKDDCVYIGDALFKGGNDETVINVIPTIAITDPTDTIRVIKSLIS